MCFLQGSSITNSNNLFPSFSSRCPDPVTNAYRPDSNFGSVTESLEKLIESHLAEEAIKKKKEDVIEPDAFRDDKDLQE
jgi:hypothetical protein